MNILVITPDGDIGRRVLAELLSPEFTVRVVTDDPAVLPEAWREQTEVIADSAMDAIMLRRALVGVDSVLWCRPAATNQELERTARTLSRALQAAGTPRLVTISAAGCGFIGGAGQPGGQPGVEDVLNESGAAIRHLHHGVLMEHLLSQVQSMMEGGTFSFPLPGDMPVPLVAADDVADVALRWLVRCDWQGNENLAVCGPAQISGHQAAVLLEQVLERPVRCQKTPPPRDFQSFITPGAQADGARSLLPLPGKPGHGWAEETVAKSAAPMTFAAWAGKYLLPLTNPASVPCECE